MQIANWRIRWQEEDKEIQEHHGGVSGCEFQEPKAGLYRVYSTEYTASVWIQGCIQLEFGLRLVHGCTSPEFKFDHYSWCGDIGG